MKLWLKCVVVVAAVLSGCKKSPAPVPDAGTWNVQAPFPAPADALAGTGLVACPIYGAQQCTAGTLQQCAIMDTTTKQIAKANMRKRSVMRFIAFSPLSHTDPCLRKFLVRETR